MPWVRIDEEFPHHPKVVKAGPLGIAMQVAALCYCNRYLTDGFVPRAVAATLLDFTGLGMRMWMGELTGGGEDAAWQLVVEDLEDAGLWERVEGGWRIHDFHDYQPTRAEVELERRKTRDRVARHRAGRTGNRGSSGRRNGEGNAVSNGGETGAPVPDPVPPVATAGDPVAATSGLPTVAAQRAARLESQDTIDVFEAWKATLSPGSRPRLTDARRDAVRAALKRYDKQDVLDAAQGWVNDPWPERAQHNDLAQLLHMGSKRKPQNVLEKMRDLWRDGPPAVMGKHTSQMASIARQMAAMSPGKEATGDLGGMDRDRALAQRQLPRPEG